MFSDFSSFIAAVKILRSTNNLFNRCIKGNHGLKPGHFNMGNAGPAGKEIKINTRYLTIGGVPQIPVMGEMQFSRIAKERWEDVILKMKSAGINIISTYIFWIHHEEIEGQFDWSGNKDFRSFVQLCAKARYVGFVPALGPGCMAKPAMEAHLTGYLQKKI
jgi:beta-galactosidase